MSLLVPCRLNYAQAEIDLAEYKSFIDSQEWFGESEVVAFLKQRRDLCLLIHLAFGHGAPDRYKHEFGIVGVFRADFVAGCTYRRHFTMVEFEGALEGSLFDRGTKQNRDWGWQLQHGMGQVLDWSWAKNESQQSAIYQNLFGMPHFNEVYLIICGRSAGLSTTELSRLHWRDAKMQVASCPIRIWTYDDLYTSASAALDVWRDANESAAVT